MLGVAYTARFALRQDLLQGSAVREPRTPKSSPVAGTETRVKIPGTGNTYEGRYAVREAEDVIASHNAFNFRPLSTAT